MRANITIPESDIETDFEYNFDLKPFNYVLDGLHWLVATPIHLALQLFKTGRNKLHTIRAEKGWKRTFKGPACIIR